MRGRKINKETGEGKGERERTGSRDLFIRKRRGREREEGKGEKDGKEEKNRGKETKE